MSALLHALRRRLPIALTLGLVVASVVGWVVWLLVPVQSEVEAWFAVKTAAPVLVEDISSNQQRNANEFDYFRRTQVAIIKTPFVLMAAVRDPAVSSLPMIKSERDPVQFLKDQLTVDFPGDSELMRISMRGSDPKQMVDLVNAVCQAYEDEVIERDKDLKSSNFELLLQTSESLRQQIAREHDGYKRLSDTLGSTSKEVIETEQKLALQDISNAGNLISSLRTKRMDYMSALEAAKIQRDELTQKSIPEYAIEQELNSDPQFQQMQGELQEKMAALRNARLHVLQDGPNGVPPSILRMQDNVAQIQAEVDEYLAERRSAVAESLQGGTVESLDGQIRAYENQMQMLDSLIAEEAAKQNNAQARLKKLSGTSPELFALERKIEQLEFSYKKVAGEVRSIEVEMKAPSRVSLIQTATMPESDTSTLKLITVGFASALAFGMTAFGLAFWELQAGRINDKSEIAEDLGLRVVGGLPGLGGRLSRRGANDDLIEAVDGLRTLLMHHSSLNGTRVVQITSAGAREGRTTLATQLAASLSRAGRRTLFIDGDLRNPTAHRLFEMPLDPGFCEVLRGQIDIDDVVHPTRIPGLWMIPAGHCDLECLHELAKEGIAAIFERLRLDFDFVVIDSGPVLAVTESLLLGKLADTTILSVLRDVSRSSQVKEAHQCLERVGVHVLGTVVQGVPSDQETRRHKLPMQLTSTS